jgi:Spy/CpxP family protein refolding chaperone
MKKTVLITMVSMLLISSVLFAQPGCKPGSMGCKPGGDKEQCMTMMQEKMDLTEDQFAKITKLKATMKMDCGTDKKEIAILKNKLEGIMLQDSPDVKAAEKLIREMGELRIEKKVEKMKMKMAMRSILTDEQQLKMGSMCGSAGMMGCDKGGKGGMMGCDKKGKSQGKGHHGAKKRCH